MPNHQEIRNRERVKLCSGVFLDMNTGLLTYTDRVGTVKVRSLQSAMSETGYRYLLYMIENNGIPLSRDEINLQAELDIEYIDRRVSEYKSVLKKFEDGVLLELVNNLISKKGHDTLILPLQDGGDSALTITDRRDLLKSSREFYDKTADKDLNSLMFSSCIILPEGEKEQRDSSLPSALEKLARNHGSAFVVSEGGTGKTSAFYELWRRILQKPDDLIPFYVKAADIDEASDAPIRSYLYRWYGADPFSLPDKHGRRIVLLLDGTNEVAVNDRLLKELSFLEKEASVFIASRLEGDRKKTKISVLVRTAGVPSENIRTLLESLDFNLTNRNLKLLEIPFYLNTFVKLMKEGLDPSSIHLSRFGLISAYLNYLKKENRYYVKDLSSEILFSLALEELLPQLCLELNLNRQMRFSAKDLPLDLDPVTRVGVISLLQHLGLVQNLETGDRSSAYRIGHQIYLDYFAARKMAECIQAGVPMSRRVRICSTSALGFLAGFLLDKDSFYKNDGRINMTRSQADQVFQLKKGRLMQARYENCSLLLYTLLDHLPNGSLTKNQFCISAEDLFAEIFRSAKSLLSAHRLVPTEDILEIPRLYSEILRRNARFEESIEVSSYLKDLAEPLDSDYLQGYALDARSSILKCRLYEAFSKAKKAPEGAFKEEVQRDYDRVLTELKVLASQAHSLSSSLYGSLMVYPDVVSMPYVEDYCRRVGIEDRRLEGFLSYMNCFRKEYLRTGADEAHFYYRYPLQKCIDCLMDGQVSRISGRNGDKYFEIYEFAEVDTGSYCSFDPDRRMESFALAERLLSLMLKEDRRAAARELNTRFLIFTAALHSEEVPKDAVCRAAADSSGYPCSAFVYEILQAQPDCRKLAQILKKLKMIAASRIPDSKDAIYHQQDIRQCWQVLKPLLPALPADVLALIEELLSADLSLSC